nr:hypothetical protein C1892_19960 [Pseudomonas sp. MPBD7-1]
MPEEKVTAGFSSTFDALSRASSLPQWICVARFVVGACLLAMGAAQHCKKTAEPCPGSADTMSSAVGGSLADCRSFHAVLS